jgi:two-component system, cell cycle sensor histidine kinase and response regulator CckA
MEPLPAVLFVDDSAVETEEIFRQVLCLVDQAVSVSDPDSKRILYLSPVHEQIWGRPLKELYENESSWIESVHPDDRERVLNAALEGQSAGTYDEQYRILRPDGEIRWIRDRAFPIRNSKQKLYRIAGIAEDITNWKFSNEQLEMRVHERT